MLTVKFYTQHIHTLKGNDELEAKRSKHGNISNRVTPSGSSVLTGRGDPKTQPKSSASLLITGILASLILLFSLY